MFGKVFSKGTVIALVIGAVMAQSVSAFDFAWGAWGRAAWVPLIIQGGADEFTTDANGDEVPKPNADGSYDTATYIWTGSGPGWNGARAAAIGFNLSGTDENGLIGFAANLRLNTGEFSVDADNDGESDVDIDNGTFWFANDNTANVWVKPLGSDVLTISAGLFQVDDLRGKLGGVNENFDGFGKSGDEDAIFGRTDSAGKFGAHFKIAPIEALQIHAAFGANAGLYKDPIDTYYKEKSGDAIGDVFSTGQYGIGYTITDIGLARVQFIGGSYGKDTLGSYPSKVQNYNQVQVAFQLTAVENLNLDFGAKIPFKITGDGPAVYDDPSGSGATFGTSDDSYQAPIAIRVAAKYTAGDLGIFFGLKTGFGGKLKGKIPAVGDITADEGFSLGADIEPSYKLGDAGSIIGNISFELKGNSTYEIGSASEVDAKDGTTKLGLGVSFHKPLGGGNFNPRISS
ncbi:MAG: hypothetical protein LBD08_06665 [Treponema sp.]|jgi:hypothetical protein|nr:hypothetical protein [Treponema sp.]